METEEFIRTAIQEDLGDGDHTSLATIDANKKGSAGLLVKENGIICGINLANSIFKIVDADIAFICNVEDGKKVQASDVVFRVEGKIQSILKAERLVLNCMQRMSGIATTTNKYIQAVSGTSVKIMDTRKTTPLLRSFEKYAVKTGGGYNHRFGLFDMILIKDNHVDGAGGILVALQKAKSYLTEMKLALPIEIETRNLSEVKEALGSKIPDRIMFDNFTPQQIREAVQLVDHAMETEASGGITLQNIRDYALTGVDCISVGALTHSVKSLDLSLKIDK